MIRYSKFKKLHVAEIWNYRGAGTTRRKAADALLVSIANTPQDLTPVVLVGPDSKVWLLWWDVAWCYRIGASHGMTALSFATRDQAIASFEAHFQQYYEGYMP